MLLVKFGSGNLRKLCLYSVGIIHFQDFLLLLIRFDTFGQCLHSGTLCHFVIVLGGGGHTCIIALKSSCLLSLDYSTDVNVHLKSQQPVESHGCLLHIERLGEIVIRRDCDVAFSHFCCTEHTIGHEHKLYVVCVLVGLDVVA